MIGSALMPGWLKTRLLGLFEVGAGEGRPRPSVPALPPGGRSVSRRGVGSAESGNCACARPASHEDGQTKRNEAAQRAGHSRHGRIISLKKLGRRLTGAGRR